MNSYVFDVGGKARKVGRFVGQVRAELQRALVHEKSVRKLTQQKIATELGVNRSVINRQLMGFENLTIRRVAELAWVLGWELVFFLRKPQAQEIITNIPQLTATTRNASNNISVQFISYNGARTGTDNPSRISA